MRGVAHSWAGWAALAIVTYGQFFLCARSESADRYPAFVDCGYGQQPAGTALHFLRSGNSVDGKRDRAWRLAKLNVLVWNQRSADITELAGKLFAHGGVFIECDRLEQSAPSERAIVAGRQNRSIESGAGITSASARVDADRRRFDGVRDYRAGERLLEFRSALLGSVATHGEHIVNQSLQYEIDAVMPETNYAGYFTSLCTIQAPNGTINPDGTPSGGYSNVAGLVDIPCRSAVPSTARVQATEVRELQEILSKGLRHILLNQCFTGAPAIDGGNENQAGWSGLGYVAVVDGVTYEILGAENDSAAQMTRLELQLATV